MKQLMLHTYDWLLSHRRWLWGGVVVIIAPLLILAATLHYHEDIMEFLPVEDDDRESLDVYQSLQSASRMVLIFEGVDAQRDNIERLCEAVDLAGELMPELITEVDIDGYVARLQYVHSLMPYFLTDKDYCRLDSFFTPMAIRAAMQRNKFILSTPGTGFLSQAIQSDPLGLLPLSIGAQGQYAGAEAQSAFVAYDGYMMTTDHHMAFAFYDSPYGSTETSLNAALVDSINAQIAIISTQIPDINIRLLGAPIIAVNNARRIKTDTALCIALSVVLILLLLLYAFPRKRDILLIMLSVSFGWLCGMSVLRIFAPQVSAIVLGIGSVLIGIAVNYPLHLLVHQRYTTSVRQTLDEVLSPLVVGNITTVGAFLTLVPLQAVALRHLGIFAASMLVGTILFCVFILPHLMSAEPTTIREIKLPQLKNPKSWAINIQTVVLYLTVAFAIYLWLCPQQHFDPNLSHINYMTPQERADFAYFDSISRVDSENNDKYLAPEARIELSHRADIWQNYWQSHNVDSVVTLIRCEATNAGFMPDIFAPFCNMLVSWQPIEPITTETLTSIWPGRFDLTALNQHLTSGLHDNFDYIGLCCSLIVFLFLWLSFRSHKLAIIAFVPMALSWIWIFAIMQIFGLQFNIVNIILATFIFGQGDDYTIFIVEGLVYEKRTGREILPQYRQSIILSALIMLIGIGVLVLAVHPAMHSLGAVALIGMSTVVIMAVTIPPLLFKIFK